MSSRSKARALRPKRISDYGDDRLRQPPRPADLACCSDSLQRNTSKFIVDLLNPVHGSCSLGLGRRMKSRRTTECLIRNTDEMCRKCRPDDRSFREGAITLQKFQSLSCGHDGPTAGEV